MASEQGIAAILARAAGLNWPAVSNNRYFSVASDEASWRTAAPGWSAADAFEASRLLGEVEDRHARAASAKDHADAVSAGPDPVLAARELELARADLARHEASRPERIERLLERVASAVESFAGVRR